MIHFDLPKQKSSILKVIGVGGGGGNAVNHMYSQKIESIDFIICNTDAQALSNSKVPHKIQLGPHLTQGLGAGANPEIGKQSTEESLEEIKRILEVNTKMAFITAGMGGGTGTGGAPIICKICKELGILTVAIVSTPFTNEGPKRMRHAEEGIQKLRDNVDTLLVISNDKLRHQYGNLKVREAFSKADDILATASKCITDVITSNGQINVDFADVCTVMRNGGVAILGSASASGENRAHKAIEEALNSPLLNDNDIRGARWILININSCEGEHEFTMDEVEVIQDYLLSNAGDNTDVILGLGYDNSLEDKIGITLIATGFEHKDPFVKEKAPQSEEKKDEKIMMVLEMPQKDEKILTAKKNDAPQEGGSLQKIDLFSNIDEDKAIEEITEPVALTGQQDAFMPTLVERVEEPAPVELLRKITVDKIEEKPEYFEISSTAETAPTIKFEQEPEPKPLQDQTATTSSTQKDITINKEASTAQSSGGFLAKPAQIYAQDEAKPISKPKQEEPLPLQIKLQEDEPVEEMQLVVKDSHQAAEEQKMHQAQPIIMSNVEEPAPQDEAEEHRRRAMERIAKLRNLSFNINAADPNNEFESVPAYLRRNMELHNSIAEVETFYSNYTVKNDENNQAEISTINTFLDGKKPD